MIQSLYFNFAIELTDNLYELSREQSPTEESLENFEQLSVQMSVLRGLLRPSRKAVFTIQKGLIDIGRSQLSLGLLADEKDNVTSGLEVKVREWVVCQIDPFLLSIGLDISNNKIDAFAIEGSEEAKDFTENWSGSEQILVGPKSVERLVVSEAL